MNRDKRKLLCSTAIRSLIKAQGVNRIFNNIYKTGTRTLKVYQTSFHQHGVDVPKLKDQITDLADAFGFDVKFKTTAGRVWSPGAFIVKL